NVTIDFTCVRHTVTMLGIQENHEHGANQGAYLGAGMDATSKSQGVFTKAISLRSSEKSSGTWTLGMVLSGYPSTGRGNERRGNTCKVGNSEQVGNIPKNAGGPPFAQLISGP